MARRTPGSIRAAHILRGKRERALFKKLNAEAVALRNAFTRFLNSSDILEDLAREQRRVEPSTNGKAVHGTKAAVDDLPPELLAIVTRALNRARPLWDDFEASIRAELLSEEIKAFEAGAQGAMRQIGFQGVFDLKNPRVLDYLATRTNMLAGGVSDTSFDAIRDTITKGFFVDGKGPLDVARDLKNEFDFLTSARARGIARTETLIASEQGAFEQFYVIGVEQKRWMSVRDENTRPWHLDADGQTVDLFEPFIVNGEEMMHVGDPTASPENIINCFVPGTQVAGSFIGGVRSEYRGPVREISTRLGQRLTVTPNHPILSYQGMIAAASLHKGDHLVAYRGHVHSKGAPFEIDQQDKPSAIEDVFEALSVRCDSFFRELSPHELHGDAPHVIGKVHVVRTDGVLGDQDISTQDQGVSESPLIVLYVEDSIHSGSRPSFKPCDWIGAATSSGVSLLEMDGGEFGVSPLERAAFPNVAHLYAALRQMRSDHPARDARFVRELFDREPGLVQWDEIVEIRDVDFQGHVYDLQSDSGFILASGIVCSNCLCGTGPVIDTGNLREPWRGE